MAINAQVDLGLVLLGRARNPEAIASAVRLFGESADPRIRKTIAERYLWLTAEPKRRDSGCFQRTALMRALRGRATFEDVPLLERALWTIEIIGRFDAASDLKAAALLTLDELDPTLAAFEATRLLTDAHEMSGQPAVTAVRLLGVREEWLPLYAVAMSGGARAEVVAESLRFLTGLPEALMGRLIDRYRNHKDEIVVLGLIDLLLAHPARGHYADVLLEQMARSTSIDLYRFIVNAIVATRDMTLIALLKREDGPASESPKGEILRQALTLVSAKPIGI